MRSFFVYMLLCADHTYYVGVTNDVTRRIEQHGEGIDPWCYTFRRRPLELVYQAEFREVIQAIEWEKRLKGWSRKKKEALIRGDEEALKYLSKRRSGKPKTVSP